jgi:Phasin protein
MSMTISAKVSLSNREEMMMAVESKSFEQGSSARGKSGATASSAQEGSEAMVNMQKELLDVYEQASRAWLARVKSEVDLWSDLATKLSATRSMPEALESYQKFVTQRMQMAAEDGRQLVEDCQKITQKMTRSLSSTGWPTTSS